MQLCTSLTTINPKPNRLSLGCGISISVNDQHNSSMTTLINLIGPSEGLGQYDRCVLSQM